MEKIEKIIEAARILDSYMEIKDGEYFVKIDIAKEKRELIQEMIHHAHRKYFLPDNFRHRIIAYTIEQIHFEINDSFNENEIIDNIIIEPDIYISDLIKWLFSHTYRQNYCDEVLKEHNVESLFELLTLAQCLEIEEIKNLVLLWISNEYNINRVLDAYKIPKIKRKIL